eukprot:CAMPEP_0181419110 /NCGR_PEP_ID=MMETSP1110-20121109/11905_1 /TAXON_ID=174948 /ORGANISM="Symbiodinium sp., Strain CCMP421" /LENGTH=115 /DNA_ID=CAMNT_0023542117 /DNA_START=93 /DNA_END=440 /DNA_ORIENTATION=+
MKTLMERAVATQESSIVSVTSNQVAFKESTVALKVCLHGAPLLLATFGSITACAVVLTLHRKVLFRNDVDVSFSAKSSKRKSTDKGIVISTPPSRICTCGALEDRIVAATGQGSQ